ncbi:MAG TPA: hypothetical protein VNI60_05735 [Pyrinomonadaceae bacterium]|nr:hypothetical protein [Pyrinomonadaceae bacterium]
MAIARKPKPTEIQAKEQSINALISKGGSVAKDREDGGNANQTENKPVLIRIPPEALRKIDEIVGAKKIKMPRHTWLLEAVFEKLEKDS